MEHSTTISSVVTITPQREGRERDLVEAVILPNLPLENLTGRQGSKELKDRKDKKRKHDSYLP